MNESTNNTAAVSPKAIARQVMAKLKQQRDPSTRSKYALPLAGLMMLCGGYAGAQMLSGNPVIPGSHATKADTKADDWGVDLKIAKPESSNSFTKLDSPLQAAAHMGKQVQLVFVSGGGYSPASGKVKLINTASSYKDPANVTIVWFPERTSINLDPKGTKGRTIAVRGTVGSYQGKTQIIVSDPANIRVY